MMTQIALTKPHQIISRWFMMRGEDADSIEARTCSHPMDTMYAHEIDECTEGEVSRSTDECILCCEILWDKSSSLWVWSRFTENNLQTH